MTDKMSSKFNVHSLLFKLPWYKETLPRVDEVVLCQVSRIDQNGVYVQLMNYIGIEGFIAFHELSKRRVTNIKSILKVGDVKLLLVLSVDSRGYVDLSNKYIIDNEDEEVIRFNQHAQVIKILHHWLIKLANKGRDSFSIELDVEDWRKVMNVTLWNYESGEVMSKFTSIASGSNSVEESFPELYEATQTSLGTTFSLTSEDFVELAKDICEHIQIFYELKLRLNVVTWAIKPTNLIKQIIHDLSDIMSCGSEKAQVVITAPEYQFNLVHREQAKLCEIQTNLQTHLDCLSTRYPDCSFRVQSVEIAQKN